MSDLENAVDDIRKVAFELGRGTHDRGSIARALGYSSGVGLAARKVAALVHYGFLSRTGAEYETTELADQVLHPRSPGEDREAILEAAKRPALFQEVLEKFESQGRLPGQLANILLRDHGITREAAPDAAGVVQRSLQFAGLVDAEGRFQRPVGPSKADMGEDVEPAPASVGNAAPVSDVASAGVPAIPSEEPGHAPHQQVMRIPLSAGVAELRVPQRLTERDLRKLRKWLELVSLDAEGGDE